MRKIPFWEQTTIDTDDLQVGMRTVKDDKIDEILSWRLPSGACRGQHFRTDLNREVCYLLGGRVVIHTP